MIHVQFSVDQTPRDTAASLSALEHTADADEVALTVEQGQMERPGALVALSAWYSARLASGRTTQLRAKHESSVLPRLFSMIESDQNPGLTAVGPNALEFLRIRNLASARLLADRVVAAIEQRDSSVSPSVLRLARFVLEELGANVVDHSGRVETGFGTMTFHSPERRLELAFADRGVGFYQSLQRNPELQGRIADDDEALQIALTPRISGTSSGRRNMGVGLKQLVEFSDLLGGDLWIVSGSAGAHRRTSAGVRTTTVRALGPWHGTWIALEARVE